MELSGCIAGSATNIERVHKLLGIEVIWQGISLLTLKGLAGSVPLPLEWNTWEWNYGWHSTLIVEWEPRTHSVRATNFSKITGGGGWLFEEDMHQYENFSTMRDYRLFRLFGLRGEPWNRVIKASWKAEQKRWFTMMRDLYNDRLEGKE